MKAVWQYPFGEIGVNACFEDWFAAKEPYPACFTGGAIFLPHADRKQSINDWLISVVMAAHARQQEAYDIILPYLPYSRQDRPMNGQPFSLKIIGDILNKMPCKRIITLDVHSDVAFACIEKLHSVSTEDIWFPKGKPVFEEWSEKTLIIPDAGAYKKLIKLEKHFQGVVIGSKTTDIVTGHKVCKGVSGDVSKKKCLIIDDICDGGATFVQLAKVLYEQDAYSVDLAITHGGFTKGLQPLKDAGIWDIYTTDSLPPIDDSLHILPVNQILKREFGYVQSFAKAAEVV